MSRLIHIAVMVLGGSACVVDLPMDEPLAIVVRIVGFAMALLACWCAAVAEVVGDRDDFDYFVYDNAEAVAMMFKVQARRLRQHPAETVDAAIFERSDVILEGAELARRHHDL